MITLRPREDVIVSRMQTATSSDGSERYLFPHFMRSVIILALNFVTSPAVDDHGHDHEIGGGCVSLDLGRRPVAFSRDPECTNGKNFDFHHTGRTTTTDVWW